MMKVLERLAKDESGITAIEYALLAAAMAAGAGALIGTTGDANSFLGKLSAKFGGILS